MANLLPCLAVMLGSTGAPSIQKLYGVSMQLRDVACLTAVVLPASGPLLPINKHPTAFMQVLPNDLRQAPKADAPVG